MTHAIKHNRADIDVYSTLIDSLFQGRKQLLIGCALQVVLVLVIGIATQERVFAVLTVLLIVLSLWRYNQTTRYFDQRDSFRGLFNDDHRLWARQWEIRYTVSTALTAAVLGTVSFVGLERSSDSQFTTIACLTLLFALVPTIVGRLYGSKLLASWSLAAAFIPPCLGFAVTADMLHLALIVLTIPYAALVLSVMNGVRLPVEFAVRRRHTISEIADRFNAALNNMANGLIMLDDANRVEVINKVARDFFELPDDLDVDGRTYDVLLRHCTAGGKSLEGKRSHLRAIFESHDIESNGRQKITDASGQVFEFSVRRGVGRNKVIVVENITSRVKSVEKIKRMARVDTLTDIPNRVRFDALVQTAQREIEDPTADIALIVVDLDDFKNINDSIGHMQGDLLLRGVSERLKTLVDENTIICRLGGDEFMVYRRNIENREEFVEDLSAILTGRYKLELDTVKVGVSIGAYFCPANEFDLKVAMVRSDIALYDAKRNGKATWSMFNEEMAERFLYRQRIKNDLQVAVENRALDVFYQPIVNTQSGKTECLEALCRWNHPELGPISPAEFIPLAEENGMIWNITVLVLNRACRDCASWPGNVRVSVNLSALDFQDTRIVDEIEKALSRSNLPAERLDVEITETAVIRDRATMEATIGQLRALGIKTSLDDFGTGQSSLSYLDTLPLDRVKIDRSFVNGIVTDERRRAMLKSITELCHILGKKVTIEGVEDVAHLEIIREEMYCDNVQGWVFAPALPAKSITELLSHSLPTALPIAKAS